MRIRELTAKGKIRQPENIQTVSDEVWFKLSQMKKCRWEPVKDEELKIKKQKK